MRKHKTFKDHLEIIVTKLLSTKFITTTTILILACVFLKDNSITSEIWGDLVKTILLIYASSNVAQAWVEKSNGSKDN